MGKVSAHRRQQIGGIPKVLIAGMLAVGTFLGAQALAFISPVQAVLISHPTSTPRSFNCSLSDDGRAYCWGANPNGQLGNGSTADSSVPVAVDRSGVLKGVALARISAYVGADNGHGHTCAVSTGGQAYCWGNNVAGQLGNGSTKNSSVPVAVNAVGVLNGVALRDISAGDDHTCALSVDGRAYCWGYGVNGHVGDGTTTQQASPVDVTWRPKTPTGITAVAGLNSATISWKAPGDVRGNAITGYVATLKPGGAACAVTMTTCTIKGLAGGTTYSVTVIATTGLGLSTPSSAPVEVTTYGLPDEPTDVIAISHGTSAEVSWQQGSGSLHGGKFLKYTVTANPGGATCESTSQAVKTCTITGLGSGTAYNYTVVTTSGAGDSAPSAPSSEIRANSTAPDAPTDVSATMGQPGSVVVSWTPGSLNGGAFVKYTVIASPGGATCQSAVETVRVCTVSELTQGVGYTFTVVTTNGIGNSAASGPSAQTTPTSAVAASPTGVTATPGAPGSVVVSWKPGSLRGGAFVKYTVTATPGNAVCESTVQATTSCTVSGLTNQMAVAPVRADARSPLTFETLTDGTPLVRTPLTDGALFSFTVVTTNNVGASLGSPPSAPVKPALVPDAPNSVASIPGNSTALVSWVPKAQGTGTPASFTACAFVDGTAPVGNSCELLGIAGARGTTAPHCTVSGAMSCTINGLANGTIYDIRVFATSSVGNSPLSAEPARVTPGYPTPPDILPAAQGSLTGAASTTIEAGSTVAVQGEGFAPNTPIALWIYSNPDYLGTAYSDLEGRFTSQVTIPAEYGGEHNVVAEGQASDGSMRTLILGITVSPVMEHRQQNLRLTTTSILALAVVLFCLGGSGILVGTVAAHRRRRARLARSLAMTENGEILFMPEELTRPTRKGWLPAPHRPRSFRTTGQEENPARKPLRARLMPHLPGRGSREDNKQRIDQNDD